MAEKVMIRQNNKFETAFWALDPHDPESDELQPVGHLHALTPYGMLLASLGSCTAIVLNTYAQHHGVDLREVELVLEYDRVFREDCERCEEITRYEEQIKEDIKLTGELGPKERHKLFLISKQCSIHKMLESGVGVQSQLAQDS